MSYRRFLSGFLMLSFLLMGMQLQAEPTVAEGKTLFKANCQSCHAKNMRAKSTGPALGGLEERWDDYPREDLYAWVRNSQKLIQEGHPRANELWNEWGSVMNNFPTLTDDQIESIILYVNGVYDGTIGETPAVAGGGGEVAVKEESNNTALYLVLLGVLGLLALILARIVSNLGRMADAKEGVETERKTLLESLLSPKVIGAVLFVLIVLGGYTTVNNAIDLGRQQGYQPAQPIKFSHVTHAGVNKIDCQYCHDGARRSKHSVIPATNTCMNCHSDIKVGSEYGTAELTKIYASAGYNPSTGKYIEDYDNMSEAETEKIFKDWIKESYKAANGEEIATGIFEVKDEEAMNLEVETQWAAIKGHVNKPVEWVRIHNLPDHVYFNHAQHVAVGKVECQTCHGKVEEMEVVQQHSPLSMGWCINCHRQTEVEFTNNPYYNEEAYKQYHDEMKAGGRKGVTVEDIGGLECQKCHY